MPPIRPAREAAIKLRRTRTCAAAILLLLFCGPRAFAACTAPAGNAGDSNYNQQWRTVQYCNGASWSSTGRPQYAAPGAFFDGVNNYMNMTTNVTMPTDNGIVSASFWVRRTGGIGTQVTIFRANTTATYTAPKIRYIMEFNNTGSHLHILASNSSGTTLLDVTTGATFTDTNWHHVMYSMDLSNSAKRFIYVDGVADTPTWTTYTSGNINLKTITTPRWSVGANTSSNAMFTGSLADFWFMSGTYIDLSVAANRRLFYNSGPVYLGPTGALPTGTSPQIFFSGPWATWFSNLGTGGGFSAPTAPVNGGDTSLTGNLNAGLIGWWKMDEGTGTTTADSAGGSTGTLVNAPTWATGKYGNALTFSHATSSSVNMGNVTGINGLNAITVSAWVKSSSSGANAHESHIVDKSDCGGNTNGGPFELLNEISSPTDLPTFAVYPYGAAGTFTDVTGTTNIDDGTWHMVTGEWDTSIQTVSIWVDGIEQRSFQTTGAGALNTTTLALDIGGYCNNSGGLSWNGLIDDVRIYNRALNWGDVLALYNQTGCGSPVGGAGDILYNATSHVPQYCDGAVWQAMGKVPGAGGAGCSTPSGTEGDVVYNADKGYMQYCDGTHWIGMGASNYGPQTGLAGWWKLDDGSGTSATDSSGNAHGGTLVNTPTWTTAGQVNGALNFNGTNQNISVPDSASLRLSASWTTSAWVNLAALPASSSYAAILAKDDPSEFSNYKLSVTNGAGNFDSGQKGFVISFDNSAGTEKYIQYDMASISTGTWYHVVGVYNSPAQTLTLYLNGAVVATTSTTGAVPSTVSGEPLTIGEFEGAAYLHGTIDDARVYNRALGPTEVKQLYTATGGHL